MLNSVLLTLLLFFQSSPPTGIIAGAVNVPAEQRPAPTLQILLLPTRFSNLWDTELQKRLDMYWERYKPAFAQNKEFFLDVSRKAQLEALDFVIIRMRRELSNNAKDYILDSVTDGKFEFKDIPFGEYKVIALGRLQNSYFILQESVDLRTPTPQFIELKKTLP